MAKPEKKLNSRVGMKYKKSGKPRKPRKVTTPNARDTVVAHKFYIEGKSATRAVTEAGYSRSYARTKARAVVHSERVKAALLQLEERILPGEIGKISKARLHENLIKPPKDPKARLGYIRTGLETDGLLGGPSELHLHAHQAQFSPTTQRMMGEMMLRIAQERGIAVTPELAK